MGLDLTEEFDNLKAYARTMAIPYSPGLHATLGRALDNPQRAVEDGLALGVHELEAFGALVRRAWYDQHSPRELSEAGTDLVEMWDSFRGQVR